MVQRDWPKGRTHVINGTKLSCPEKYYILLQNHLVYDRCSFSCIKCTTEPTAETEIEPEKSPKPNLRKYFLPFTC